MKIISDRIKIQLNGIKEESAIWIIVFLLFCERVYAASKLGITYNLGSDDLSYINSGIEFANTGRITMHGVLSAQIMPGMTWLLGGIFFCVGEGRWLWCFAKALWFAMGSLTAKYIYKCVTIFAPKWCGILSVLPLFLADFVWMDNLVLTETPFMFFLVIMIYETLMMGKTSENKYFWRCAFAYMGALMFKANIALYPIFAMFYLMLVKYDFKNLLKQGLILGGMVLCFVIPWSVRNYICFESFVPLTWGAGNPMLLGTYQGYGYPDDAELDYKTNVEDIMKEKYEKYYDEEGEPVKAYLRGYLSLEQDMVKAKYRMKEWWKRNPVSMIISYGVLKPKLMIDSVFYWEEILGISTAFALSMRRIDGVLCLMTILLAFLFKKYRSQITFLALLYLGNIYIYAMTFAFSRYAATLMPIRYIIVGIGGYIVYDIVNVLMHQGKRN